MLESLRTILVYLHQHSSFATIVPSMFVVILHRPPRSTFSSVCVCFCVFFYLCCLCSFQEFRSHCVPSVFSCSSIGLLVLFSPVKQELPERRSNFQNCLTIFLAEPGHKWKHRQNAQRTREFSAIVKVTAFIKRTPSLD